MPGKKNLKEELKEELREQQGMRNMLSVFPLLPASY